MSTLSILPYFPFDRVRITKQSVSSDSDISQLTAIPDHRFSPKCHVCGSKAQRIHSHEKRSIRDLNIGSTRVWINCSYRKVICAPCNRIVVEDLEFFEPYIRVTRRLALFIYELCKVLTVKDVAKHFGINLTGKRLKLSISISLNNNTVKQTIMAFVYWQLTK
jgi:transposase